MEIKKDTDSDALRSRRYRAHRRDDHRWCRPEKCHGARLAAAGFVAEEEEPPGSATAAVDALIDALPEATASPSRTVLCEVARKLAEAVDGGGPGLAGAARQLRDVVNMLDDLGDDRLSELRVKRHQRRAAVVLDAHARGPS